MAQSFKDIEIIIIDDASDDYTRKSLSEILRLDARIKLIRNEKNLGPGFTRNVGIKNAKGEYLAIMDDDDISLPQRLHSQKNLFNKDPKLGLVFSSVGWMNDKLEIYEVFPGIVKRGEFPTDPKKIFELLYTQGNKIPNSSIMIKKDIINDIGYPEKPWIGEDWLLCMKLAALGTRMAAISEPLVMVRRDFLSAGLMSNKKKAFMAQRQVLSLIWIWLEQKGIRDFDHLHRIAFSNQLIREARFWSGFKGLGLALKAMLVSPNNIEALKTISWIINKIPRKLARYY